MTRAGSRRSHADLEDHPTHRRHEPAWLLLSPTLLPGVYLVEHGRRAATVLGPLCRAIEVQLDALGEGDAEGMVHSFSCRRSICAASMTGQSARR